MRKTFSATASCHFYNQCHVSPGLNTDGYVSFQLFTVCRPDSYVATNLEKQFRDAFMFFADTVATGGLSWETVVKMITYRVDLRKHLDAFIKVKYAFIATPYPA